MAVKFRGSGKIPGIPIHADTSPAYAEVDKFIKDTGDLTQTVKFDANFTQAEGRLKRFLQTKNREMFLDVKINDKKIDEALKTGSKSVLLDAAFRINQDSLKGVLNDAKLLSQGISAAMSQGLTGEVERMRGTLKSFFDEYGDLKTIVDGKVVSGLRNILDSADDLSAIGNIAFNVESLEKAEALTAKIFENESNITKELTKQEKKDLWKKLGTYTRKIKNNLSDLATSDMREVLSIIEKLKDTTEYGNQIEETFGRIAASFVGIGEVTGLQEVVEEFENSASALRNVEWGFGKKHDRDQLIEDQKEIIGQLKQIGKLRYSTSVARDGRMGQEKIDVLGRFDDDELESRFTEDQLRTRLILLNQLRDNIDQYIKLTKSNKNYLFDDDIDKGDNFYGGLLGEISREQKYIDKLKQYREEDYDVPSPEALYKKFKDHVDSTLDRKEMSKQLREDFEFYSEAILNGRYSLEQAIDSFAKDVKIDKLNSAWEQMTDGIEVPQGLLSKTEEWAGRIRNGTLTLEDAISEAQEVADRLQVATIPDDYYDDLDEVFESENLRHYNELIEECTQLTGELSDAVAKHARIQREIVSIWQSGDSAPKELLQAREQIEEVISGYFKKDLSEPLLSSDGIIMWLQSHEAAAMSVTALVENMETKFVHAAQIEVEDRKAAEEAIRRHTEAIKEHETVKKTAEQKSLRAFKMAVEGRLYRTEPYDTDGKQKRATSDIKQLNGYKKKLEELYRQGQITQQQMQEIESQYDSTIRHMLDLGANNIEILPSILSEPESTSDLLNAMADSLDKERQNVERAADALVAARKGVGQAYSGDVYHGSKTPLDNVQYDPSKGTGWRNLGAGLYVTPDLELAAAYGENIVKKSVALKNVFMLTEDFITNIDDLYAAMGAQKPDNASWNTLTAALSASLNTKSQIKNFTKRMQKMGYDGMYSKGYGFSDKSAEQLVIYDEEYWKNLTTIPASTLKSIEQATQAEQHLAKATEEANTQFKKQQDISMMVSGDIINKITQGVDIEKMLADRGLQGEQLTKGIDLFKDFAGSLYLGDSSPESSQDLFTELFDFVVSNAKTIQQTQKTLGDFRDYMKSRQIRIPENMENTFAEEFVDSWKELEKLYAIGGNSKNKKKLLTTSKYASTPDALVEELIENGFGYVFNSKMMENFNGSPQDSLRMLLDAIQRAKDEFKLPKTQTIFGMDEEEQNDFVTKLSEATAQVEKNIMGLHTSIVKTSEDNDILAESADRTASALERKAVSAEDAAAAMRELQDAEESAPKKPIKQDEDNTIEPILQIAEESAKMIELISSAAGKSAATKFLEGITDETDLQNRVADYFNEVFGGSDWKFKDGKGAYSLVGNTLTAHLVNSTQDAIDAVFKLNDGTLELQENLTRFNKANIEPFNVTNAIKDATSKVEELKLELGDIEYTGLSKLQESLKAIVDEKTFRAFNEQLKISQKEVKKIADDTKWIIEQNKQVDAKVRSYKYGSKQLNGTTELEDPDATSMEESANKTIDGLADHIRTRLKNVAAGTLTDAMKNIIRNDMRVLENEIKVGQLEKYTSTTMSASEAEAARKSLINQLDTLKAQAEKSNVFDKISESYDKLRQRLTDETSSDYIKNNFVDAVNETRVIRSELNKAVAESGLEKQRQQHLDNTLKIQERLYEAKKKYVELDANESTNSSDLQVAERKIDELQQQYDKSLAILKNAEDYNAIKQRELQLEQELYAVQGEADHAGIQRIEKAAVAEQLKIQKQQKANYEELISLQKKYNEADYNWHKADISGEDKSPYNEQMESYIERMRELRKETALTAEQQIELNKINNDHKVKKNKLLDAVAAADSKSLSELKTFSRWESDIKNVGMLSDETVQRIKDMRTAIDGISEGTDIKKLAEDFKELKSEVKYETTQSKATKTRMADIKASLKTEQEELDSLYKQLDLDLDLGNAAHSADEIKKSYKEATDEIKKCTSAIGEQSREELAASMKIIESAKEKMKVRQEAEYKWWYGDGSGGGGGNPPDNPPFDDNKIKQWYQSLNSTIQQISKIETKMHGLMLKDDGTGAWAPLIESLESQRSVLLDRVRDIGKEINTAFNGQFVLGDQVDLPFSSILSSIKDFDAPDVISNFFSDIRTQTVLSEQSIEKFVANLQGAQNKTEEFSTTMKEGIYSTLQSSETTLANLYSRGMVDSQNEKYKLAVKELVEYQNAIKSLTDVSTGKLTDPSSWTAQQIIGILEMTNALNKYTSEVKTGAEAEAKYFEAKKQYANISNLQGYDEMASNMDKTSSGTNDAREKLEKFVSEFEGGKKVITGFTTSADGISRIDFSVLEEGTGHLRNFSAEMGQFTSNIYTFETSMKNMTAGTNAVQSSLGSMEQLMRRLNSRGMTADNNDYVADLKKQIDALNSLFIERGASKDLGDQAIMQNAAMDAERLMATIKALEKVWLDVNDAAAGGDLFKLGTFDKNQDSAEQFAKSLQVLAAKMNGTVVNAGNFTGEINKIPVSIETADGEIKNFIVDVEKLGHTITASLKSTEKAKTGWQEFTGGVGGLGKEILKYGSTLVGVYDFVRYLKQGFNEVLEIDTAMTELKKVTSETDIAYSNFLKNAYTSSKKIGTTMKDFTQATADFARLGYTLDEASKLAEAANVYMNVGDGIEDVGAASESIISTMKAFGIEAEDSMGIVNRFNEVGKILPVDNYIG